MILKGNQRAGGRALAAHLTNDRDNDHVELHELRGFASRDLAGAMLEIEATARGTRCQQPFFAVSLNPPKGHSVSVGQFEDAASAVEAKYPALKEQPRAIIFHEKEGRRHAHAVWGRINEQGRAIALSFTRERLREASRRMFQEMGIEAPPGLHDRLKADPLNYDQPTWQQAKRIAEDPRNLKRIISDAWERSDNQASFEAALAQHALTLAKGDRRGFVVVHHSGQALSLSRYAGIKTRELAARVGDSQALPSVAQVRDGQRQRITAEAGQKRQAIEQRHKAELRPLIEEHRQIKAAHRQQRRELDSRQSARLNKEELGRGDRLRKGIMGLWDRLTGKRGKISELNAKEAATGKERDRGERQAMIDTQGETRAELQERYQQTQERQRQEIESHHAELAAMLDMTREAEGIEQAQESEAGQELSNPEHSQAQEGLTHEADGTGEEQTRSRGRGRGRSRSREENRPGGGRAGRGPR